MKTANSQAIFRRCAQATSHATGHSTAFFTACALVLLWALTGPLFKYSTDWQLVINTGTTIVTFLMVFLIQNTQNRDSEAMHLKLDELIRAMEGAHNALLDLEGLEEGDRDKIRRNYLNLPKSAREATRRGEIEPGPREPKGRRASRNERR